MLTEAQLSERRSGIGGSDSPIVMGLSPYRDPLHLYYEKRGEIEPEDISSKGPVEWGNLLEEPVAQKYAAETGFRVIRDNKTRRSREYPFMLCHLDRVVQKAGDRRGLEVKTSSVFDGWGESGTNQVPDHVYCQAQHNISVAELDQMDVPVLLGGNDFRIFHIPRNDKFIEELIWTEEEFWDRVQAGLPPEPDWASRSVTQLLKSMYPGTDGEIIELGDVAQHWHAVMSDAAEQRKMYEAVERGAKNRILSMMGESAIGLLPDGSAFTRKTVERGGYTVEPSSYIDFRHTNRLPKAAQDYLKSKE
jgi:putative phage-type endonuclease